MSMHVLPLKVLILEVTFSGHNLVSGTTSFFIDVAELQREQNTLHSFHDCIVSSCEVLYP